ncbi:MAG: DUF3006 domain-containing protein [Clostridia bacterium]|nr:DUF3006 domain-containing protein [Clostridia bacterium]
MKYTVDRIDGDHAVLESDKEKRFIVPVSLLPEGIREGSRVAEESGVYTLDLTEEKALRRQRYRAQQRLKKKCAARKTPRKKNEKNQY